MDGTEQNAAFLGQKTQTPFWGKTPPAAGRVGADGQDRVSPGPPQDEGDMGQACAPLPPAWAAASPKLGEK